MNLKKLAINKTCELIFKEILRLVGSSGECDAAD